MVIGEEIRVAGDWFIIHFTENNGMAFGMEFAGEYGKLALSVFRIIAVGGIGYYLYTQVKRGAPTGLVVSISLILAGALGNILDSAFYGLIFNESMTQVATLFPEDGGYAGFLHGRVVDMLYFPVMDGTFPDWLPKWGGDHFVFFRPVFNVADSAITVGVFMIILFQKRYFKPDSPADAMANETAPAAENSTAA